MTPMDLPLPAPEAQAHSQRLVEVIRAEIAVGGGRIDFARFMELALYAPGLGYYVAGARKIGEAGDFITAPELSPLFSRCLARQCAQVLAALGDGDMLEFGAGAGTMAADILNELAALEQLPQRYFILEVSPELRQRQQQTLEARAPQWYGCVEWLDALPPTLHGVVLANEVLDAMPVHLLRAEVDGWRELQVGWGDNGFVLQATALANDELRLQADALWREAGPAVFVPGYTGEINLAARAWVSSVAALLAAGAAFIIDYGFPRREFYHPDRGMGTLMCHYRHRAHADPFLWPGLQDITAHVDFTAVAEAAHAAGLDIAGYTSQAQFLLGCGLGELLQQAATDNVRAHLTLTQAVKKLTLPSEMGELFKVMALTRNLDIPLRGFMLQDRRHRL